MTSLTTLGLDDTQVTDAGLVHLKDLTSLTTLELGGPQITDAGLEHLKGMTSLTSLGLHGPQITGAGLVHLKGMTSLTTLALNGSLITGAGLVHLKGLTSLTTLRLNETQITDAGLVHLKGQASLTTLGLSFTQITDAGLEHLKGLTSLTVLSLTFTQITDAGLEQLKGLTSLTELNLTHTPITDAGLEHLKGMTSLTTLYLGSTQITDAGLVHLQGMTSLTSLDLRSTQITDAGLEHLKGMTSLAALNLDNTQITDAGLEQIKAALPNCRIPAESAAAVHEAARRRQSKNKLQQLGLAMHIYHDAWKHFPRGTVENLELKPEERLSWVVALLPYMGQAALYNQIDQKSAWDAVKNKQLSEMTVPTLQNPSQRRPSDMPGSMDYVAIGGIGPDAASLPKSDEKAGIFGYDRETRFRDITDGMSNTIAITDSSTPNTSYMQGGKLSIKSFSQQPYVNGPDGIGSPHAGGFQVSLADGSVRFVSENIDPKVLEALATMHGGEVIGEY